VKNRNPERNLLHQLFYQAARQLSALGLIAACITLVSCSGVSTTAISTTPASTQPTLYHLRSGDVVQVDVFQEPIMTTRQRVLGDGTIFVGLIGRVNVMGDSVEEAATKIGSILNQKQLVNPQVTITILAYAPRRFTVWGQVKAAGTYVIPPEETMCMPEALATAGGNTVIGNPKKVVVNRRVGNTVQQIRVNAYSPQGQLFQIQEGDVIFVPETIF
jgi:protein involved in polysaccharide export with SLBB domain